MPEEQNYYEQMGIPIDATDSQIREAYKKLTKKYHPDLNPDMPQWAANQMKKLNITYNTLIDPDKRQAYDRKIGKKQTSTTSSHTSDYMRQWNDGKYENRETLKIHEIFGNIPRRTVKIAAIGTCTFGLAAFLMLYFSPIKHILERNEGGWERTISDKSLLVKNLGENQGNRSEGFGSNGFISEHDKRVDVIKAEVHYRQGINHVKNDAIPEAKMEFENAIKFNPEHFRAHANLGFTYEIEGRLDEAVREYEKAIEINPEFADAYHGLAVTYKKKEMFDEAEQALDRYKRLTERQGFH